MDISTFTTDMILKNINIKKDGVEPLIKTLDNLPLTSDNAKLRDAIVCILAADNDILRPGLSTLKPTVEVKKSYIPVKLRDINHNDPNDSTIE